MRSFRTFILVAVSILIVTACTIERRVHNKGFHVEWRKSYKTDKKIGAEEAFAPRIEENENSLHNENFNQDLTSQTDDATSLSTNAAYPESDLFPTNLENGAHFTSIIHAQIIVEKEVASTGPSIKQGHQKTKLHLDAEPSEGGKSQIIALILVLLVGILGIHRFYLGYYGVGVLMLLTFGLCGILALIDLIRIVIGDLKPKYDEYTETL